ncbi:MAG: Hsp20/alpha crystallin family protein [Oligoflexia bacterium]|nr:Hsp20/alpha crystallin family protein [Oligoflexia bacterium]
MVWSEFPSFFLRDPWAAFEPSFPRIMSASTEPLPRANFWGDESKLLAVIEIPGVASENCDVSVQGKALTVSGARPREDVEGERERGDRWSGEFTRSFELPYEIEADAVEAKLKNGLLQITLPRANSSKPRKISVK